jgi:hypothetical protein
LTCTTVQLCTRDLLQTPGGVHTHENPLFCMTDNCHVEIHHMHRQTAKSDTDQLQIRISYRYRYPSDSDTSDSLCKPSCKTSSARFAHIFCTDCFVCDQILRNLVEDEFKPHFVTALEEAPHRHHIHSTTSMALARGANPSQEIKSRNCKGIPARTPCTSIAHKVSGCRLLQQTGTRTRCQ